MSNIYEPKYINNFRIVGLKNPSVEPPQLEEIIEFEGFKIFHSSYDTKIFVIYDHITGNYYAYERQLFLEDEEEHFVRILKDLEMIVKEIFVPKLG